MFPLDYIIFCGTRPIILFIPYLSIR
jgi:hypothetical protein